MDNILLTLSTVCLVIAVARGADNEFTTASEVEAEPNIIEGAEPELHWADNITITTIEMAPFVMKKTGSHDGNDQYEGFIVDMLKQLCTRKRMPCNYELVLARDGKIGAYDGLDSYDGVIGEVAKEYADIGAAPISEPSQISGVNRPDFTEPWEENSLTVLVHRDLNVKDLRDLVARPNVKIISLANSRANGVVSSNETKIFIDLWGKVLTDHVETVRDGVARVENGSVAFIMESAVAQYYANKNANCDLQRLEGFLAQGGYTFAVKKTRSDLLAQLNAGIAEMKQDLTLETLKSEWFKAGRCGAASAAVSLLLLAGAALLAGAFSRV